MEALTQQGPAVIALRDALAPTRSSAPGVVVEGRLDPAEGVLAGDWYDAIDLPGGRVGVVVGDVAGLCGDAGDAEEGDVVLVLMTDSMSW